jgi:MFS family permease
MLAALGWSLTSFAVPPLRERFSTSALVFAAALLLVVGCGALVTATIVPLFIPVIFLCWIWGGAGIGIAYTTIFSDVFEGAEGGREGATTSTALMAALLGMVFGTGAGGVALTLAQHSGFTIDAGLTAAFGVALACAIALGCIANRQSSPEAVEYSGER